MKLLLALAAAAPSMRCAFAFNRPPPSSPHKLLSSSTSTTKLHLYKQVKWTPQDGSHVMIPKWHPGHPTDTYAPPSSSLDTSSYTTSSAGGGENEYYAPSDFSADAPSSSSSTTPIITDISLEIADALSNHVVAATIRNNFAPITVTITDTRANILVQKKMDNCIGPAFTDFSYAKAYTCVALNVSSREFRDKYTNDDNASKIAQLNSMMSITNGKMAAFPGGVLLRNLEGEVVGAIGVSGAAGDEDEYVALKGVWDSGLGLRTWPSEHSCTTATD